MALFKTSKERDAKKKKERAAEVAAKVEKMNVPPSKMTGAGDPMEKRGDVIRSKIRNKQPIMDSNLYSRTEFVAKRRAQIGLPSAEELTKRVAAAKKKHKLSQK